MASTAWIHLAPIGIIPVSMLNLLDQVPYPVAREMVLVVMILSGDLVSGGLSWLFF